MIYPSADKLNKVGSKYKLIAMASTRAKQISAGMKPLIKTESTNPLTIAFEEIAAGVITANIEDVNEVSVDYDELSRTSSSIELKYSREKGEEVAPLDQTIENTINAMATDEDDKIELAEQIKNQQTDLDDIKTNDLSMDDTENLDEK